MANAARSTPARRGGGTLPFTIVLGILTGVLLLSLTQPPLLDVDIYWHLRAGQELLDGTPPDQLGTGWSFASDPRSWTTTQWLSEVALQLIFQAGNWPALIAFRTLTAAMVLGVLAYATLKGRSPVLAAFPYSVAAFAVIGASQERPQQVTLLGAATMGLIVVRGLTQGGVPRWWLVLPGTALWANLHGGWVLVPLSLGLVALGRVLDHGIRDGIGRRFLAVGLLSVLAGSASPVGPAGALSGLRFADASDAITEWARTEPLSDIGLVTAAMLLLIAIAWSRSPRIPYSEVLVTTALMAFSWTAWRNVAPAMLMLAPMVAHRLCVAFPRVGAQPEPRWAAPAGVVVACGLTLLGLASVPSREHLPSEKYPTQLAQQIAKLPGAQRVLNDYNVAGLVLHFAGQDDRVAIDGRADRYGAEAIDDHLRLIAMTGDWEETLRRLDPTSALLEADSPLAYYLEQGLMWHVTGRQGNWVLLRADR